jgi:hypothetical protein
LLVTPRRFQVPLYMQLELNSTALVDGPGATTVAVAPELFVGPVHGVRIAGGVSSTSPAIPSTSAPIH